MNKKTFNSTELLEILTFLNSELAKNKLKLEIAVYGGAAIMLYYGERTRDLTEDIDAVVLNRQEFGRQPAVFEAVAKRFNLADDWINSNIMNTLSELKREELILFGDFSNITIKLPNKEQLLAMKVKSARYFPKSDYDDARQLALELGVDSLAKLQEIVDEYIPSFLITDDVKKFLCAIMEEL